MDISRHCSTCSAMCGWLQCGRGQWSYLWSPPQGPGHNPWSPHSWPQQVGEAATGQQTTLDTTLETTLETTQGSMTSSSLPPEPLPCLTPVVRGAPSISPKVVFWQGQYITLPQLYAVRFKIMYCVLVGRRPQNQH